MVTLDDVARTAGVSRTTASRAMNGISTVDPHRAAAVLDAAETLGFRPNPAARSLARGRHDSIALIVDESDIADVTNAFFTVALRGAIREIAKSDQQLVMLLRADDETDEKFLRYLESSHVDGILVILEAHNVGLPRLLSEATVPVVYLGRPAESTTTSVSYVDSDNEGGGRMATQALVDAGRRRVGVVAGPFGMGVTQDRLRGWSAVLREHGFSDDLVAYANFHTDGGATAMRELLELDPTIDSVFVMSDLMTAGALMTLRQQGVQVPDDIAIVSFDDTVIATTAEPSLTTVRQPLKELGALMVTTLQKLIVDPAQAPIQLTLPTTLIRRESV